MNGTLKNCFFLPICIIFILPGFAYSEENKSDPESARSDKKYSMKIIRPNPNIDPEIVKNTCDPNIDYKLRIIDPYTKKEITGNKEPCFVYPQNKFPPGGKR